MYAERKTASAAHVMLMIVEDIVYGSKEIKENVLIDLMAAKAFIRLKGICNQGVPKEYILPSQPNFYRYEHCVGVMLALKMVNATLEEQVAGLLHDVSHTAFSHLIDYVFGGGQNEDYQDKIHYKFFADGTELSNILEKHGFNPNKISDLKAYGLLEREQPQLCADRFDYTLRYWAHSGDLTFVKSCIGAVTAKDGVMVFNSFETAKEFAEKHTIWQPEWKGWGGTQFDMRIRWYIFGSALEIAIEKGIVAKDDFLETDSYVLGKLKRANDPEITKLLDLLSKPLQYEVTDEEPKVTLKSKFRYVDPMFMQDGKIKKVSEIDNQFNKTTEEHRRMNEIGIKLKSIKGIEVPISVKA